MSELVTRTKFHGTCRLSKGNKKPWQAVLSRAGKRISLGCYPTELEAAWAYNLAASLAPGPGRVLLNRIPEDRISDPTWAAATEQTVRRILVEKALIKPLRAALPWELVLEVLPEATRDQVRTAYRKLSSLYHPDHGGDMESFVKIHTAWEQARAYFSSESHSDS